MKFFYTTAFLSSFIFATASYGTIIENLKFEYSSDEAESKNARTMACKIDILDADKNETIGSYQKNISFDSEEPVGTLFAQIFAQNIEIPEGVKAIKFLVGTTYLDQTPKECLVSQKETRLTLNEGKISFQTVKIIAKLEGFGYEGNTRHVSISGAPKVLYRTIK